MLNSETLEVAIGMAFLFLSVSLICTAGKEWLEGIFKWRAMDLERALRVLLADPDGKITAQLLNHPLLDSLFPGSYDCTKLRPSRLAPGKGAKHMPLSARRNLPSYIPSTQFAVALLDSVARGPAMPKGGDDNGGDPLAGAPLTLASMRAAALALPPSQLQRAVIAALDHADDLAQARRNIEQWFDGAMDRASGWYKRRTQLVLFLLGITAAALLNVDALHVMHTLTADKSFRAAVVNQAASTHPPADDTTQAPGARIEAVRSELESVGVPIGWRVWTPPSVAGKDSPTELRPVPTQLCATTAAGSADAACHRATWLGSDWILVVCGWLLTAFAVTLGAPFWFDVLDRFMMVRSTSKPAPAPPPAAGTKAGQGDSPPAGGTAGA